MGKIEIIFTSCFRYIISKLKFLSKFFYIIKKHEHSQGSTSWDTCSEVVSLLTSEFVSLQSYSVEASNPSDASKLLKKDVVTLAETDAPTLIVSCASLDQVVPIVY